MGDCERDQERIQLLWYELETETDNEQMQRDDDDESLAFDELEYHYTHSEE